MGAPFDSPRPTPVRTQVELPSAGTVSGGESGALVPGLDPWTDRLTLLLESTGEGIFGIDLEGRCIFVNRAGAEALGYRRDEMLGRNMHCLIHHTHEDGRTYPEKQCPIFRAFRQGRPCRIDTDVLWRADGSHFPAEYSSHPIMDAGRVLGAVVTFTDITDRRRAEEMLRRANDTLERRVAERTQELSQALAQLRELSAYSHSVREEERTRMSREIHDELGSLLVALKLDLAWMDRRVDGAVKEKCGSMASLIDRAVDNVGRIITDLRPSLLDHQGLWAALEWQVREFAEHTGIRCSWRQLVDGAETPAGALASAIFRIFQEMLSNVARHAQASAATIDIETRGALLVVEVADDGRGAPASAFSSPRAYGVMGMSERARHFGGAVHIDSRPGRGTTVRLEMPLTGEDKP